MAETKNSYSRLSSPNGNNSFCSLAKMISETSLPPLISEKEVVSTSKDKADLFVKQFKLQTLLLITQSITLYLLSNRSLQYVQNYLQSRVSPQSSQIFCFEWYSANCAYAHELAPISSHLFRILYDLCIFPDSWKIPRVQPIFKKESKSILPNYRPIKQNKLIEFIISSNTLK